MSSFPETCEALENAGYDRRFYSRCKGCGESIEWWTTPFGAHMPMEHMPQPDSKAIPHWSVCPKANEFRKEKERQTCTTDDSQLQFDLSPTQQPTVNNPKKKGGS